MRKIPALGLGILLLVLLAGQAPGLHAQVSAPPGYTVMPAGWNLISTATAVSLNVPSATGTLFTLQAGDSAYELGGWSQLATGYGYWALFNENTALHLPPSTVDTYSVTAPAGEWVMVGNPSTSGSVRVSGADQVWVYSALSGFRQDSLIPVGYGAFVMSDAGGTITLSLNAADRTVADFGTCCTIGSGQYGGKAHLDVLDDSPYGLLYGVRQVDQANSFVAPVAGNYAYGLVPACVGCSEYNAAPSSCRSQATALSIDVTPGTYLIRLTTDGPRVADIILTVPLQANTHYYFCRWIAAGRQ